MVGSADARVAAEAQDAALAAASRAGVEIREATTGETMRALAQLFSSVWGRVDPAVPPELLTAFAHAGDLVAAAYGDGEMVAGIAGFLGRHGDALHLHSHILGVAPGTQARGVGFAMKLHQRAWALSRDIPTVEWTYDPLVRRNAFFNVTKLGAEPVTYHEDLYGPMEDELNAGTPTDRLLVRWDLAGRRATAASLGRSAEPDLDRLRAGGATVALDVGRGGKPVTSDERRDLLLCRVPEDVVALRERDQETARAWVPAVRETLGWALSTGYRVAGMTRDGWYVLSRTHGPVDLRDARNAR